jgi:hypothetical protein
MAKRVAEEENKIESRLALKARINVQFEEFYSTQQQAVAQPQPREMDWH